ncbi:MAG: DUF1294 domain-containing protein [Clostridia bacterium]|nr:DUF1294 domain-containing protein [Clostridia bacterium]
MGILEVFDLRYIVLYFFIINLVGFLAMGIDKYKAQKDLWRIPEGTLITIALIGGSIGAIIGMKCFRHKTKKLKFSVGLPTILISEVALVIYCLVKFL